MSKTKTKRKKGKKDEEEGQHMQHTSLSIDGREVEEGQKFQY
jgi:hypothetical protein